jgi:hypothetical protein
MAVTEWFAYFPGLPHSLAVQAEWLFHVLAGLATSAYGSLLEQP